MMVRSQICLALLVLSTAACSAVDPSEADVDENDVGSAQQAFTDVAGLKLKILPIDSFDPAWPQYISGCIASFTDKVHALEVRCIMQQFTPQTNSWRNVTGWETKTAVSNAVAVDVSTTCDANRVSVVRAIARGRVRTKSGGWTDLEELVGPATSVRCVK